MQSSALHWIWEVNTVIPNQYKILVVEDDANIRTIVTTILESSG